MLLPASHPAGACYYCSTSFACHWASYGSRTGCSEIKQDCCIFRLDPLYTGTSRRLAKLRLRSKESLSWRPTTISLLFRWFRQFYPLLSLSPWTSERSAQLEASSRPEQKLIKFVVEWKHSRKPTEWNEFSMSVMVVLVKLIEEERRLGLLARNEPRCHGHPAPVNFHFSFYLGNFIVPTLYAISRLQRILRVESLGRRKGVADLLFIYKRQMCLMLMLVWGVKETTWCLFLRKSYEKIVWFSVHDYGGTGN